MTAACELHRDRPAVGTARGDSPVAPYVRHIPLCDPCLDRMEAIGFPATRDDGGRSDDA